ncbi:MAG: hypothetical protein H7Y88_11820 [Phycisphaerales bacterium]|nr:hypothetical protein [Phycisphaerales bacterium]
MAGSTSAVKVCVICAKDVSAAPRVKDGQGNYLCMAGDCQQKMMARVRTAAAAPKAAPVLLGDDEMGLMDKLISASPMLTSAKCTECGWPLRSGAMICTHCGFNSQTGKAVKTRLTVENAPKEKRVKVKGGNRCAIKEFGPSFGTLLLVFCVVFCGLGALGFMGKEAWGVAMVLLILASGIAWLGTVVAAFMNDQAMWGICGLVPIVNIVFLFYALAVNQEKWSKSLFIATLLGQVILWMALAINPELMDMLKKG